MQTLAVFCRLELVVCAAGQDRRLECGNRSLIENRAKRAGSNDVDVLRQQRIDIHGRRAELVHHLLHAALIHIGDDQFRASFVQETTQVITDITDALHRDRQTVNAVPAEFEPHGCLDAPEDPERRLRRRIAPGLALLARDAGDVLGRARDLVHVVDAHADVLGRDIVPVERIDEFAIALEQRVAGLEVRRPEHDRFAAAELEAGHRVLVAHSLRKSQHVVECVVVARVMP